jgi:hypothetical protein
VQAEIDLRLGVGKEGTWMAKPELKTALAQPAPRFQLVGQPMLISLLRHEQGHFDITTLLVRDCFNEVAALVQPKPTPFKTWGDLEAAVRRPHAVAMELERHLRGEHKPPGQEGDGLYPREAKRGQDMQGQARWNAILRLAWSNRRPLREVLKIVNRGFARFLERLSADMGSPL